MADTSRVVEYLLKMRDEASAALKQAGAAADEVKRKTQELDRATVQMTAEEKQLAAAMIASEAKLQAKARATGLTTAQVRELERQMRALKESQARANAETGAMTATTALAARGMGSFSHQARGVGLQLAQVFQVVQAGGDPMRALAVQLPDIATQLDLAAVASKAWAVAASPLGLALASVAAVVATVANRIDEASTALDIQIGKLDSATAATTRYARSQAALRAGSGDVAGFVGGLQIQTALLRGEIDKADVVAGQLGGTLADKLKPEMLAAAQAATQNQVQIERLRRALAGPSRGVAWTLEQVNTLKEAEAQQPALEANLARLKALYEEGRVAIDGYTDALQEQAAAEAALKGASTGKGGSTAKDMAELAERMRRFREMRTFLAGETGTVGMSAADFGFTTGEAQAMWETSLSRALRSSAPSVAAAEMMQSAIQRAMSGVAGRVSASGTALGQIGGAIADPLGALATMGGPQAAGIAAGLQMLAEVGREGTDRIIERLEMLGQNIVQGAAQLPELFDRLVTELPHAIGQAVGEALRDMLSAQGLADRAKDTGIIRALAGRFTMGGSEALLGAIEGLTGANIPRFDVGDSRFVSRTGLALLHEGERVVRSSGVAAPSTTARMGGRAGAVVNINGWVSPRVVDDLVRAVGADYDPNGYGRGLSPSFGG